MRTRCGPRVLTDARDTASGSIAGLRPQSVVTYAYDISKSAVIAASMLGTVPPHDVTSVHVQVHYLTQSLVAPLSAKNITINAIAPGYVPR
jgi:NAD(P)-dependent dehydrogenase (short-subunit alcohol dehydrogenase family)